MWYVTYFDMKEIYVGNGFYDGKFHKTYERGSFGNAKKKTQKTHILNITRFISDS